MGRDATVVLGVHHSLGLSVGAAVGGCCGHQGALVVGTFLSVITNHVNFAFFIKNNNNYLHRSQPC